MTTKKNIPHNHLTIGKRGEQIATDYLRANNWKILARNFRTSHGEIDVVASHKHKRDGQRINIIAFIEVKTRLNSSRGAPERSVTYKKRLKIISLAKQFIRANNLYDEIFRFDVMTVDLSQRPPKVRHLEAAFDIHGAIR